ncbi:tungstate ABC transporter ATP-binding protein [Desulfuromonas versatilis]|uniref:Tungstate ABC transporter ATP-binding protein n=1 Tax=Desulfuromonas versatilis TaxID=2802975 RepID=A0ABN6E277_9BACT|nr:ATP-binding cassette domain-containing protein [Desulfuromonas versatilis]BCR06460.1 tungstate ABC transporter ATP-binding protein [Desulfuromonas versatilis]
MEPLYTLHNIEKKVGENFLLRVEKLELFAGGLYSLAGPNGAGKSTLLNILAFLTSPDRGELFFAGERASWTAGWLQHKRQEVTLVPQNPFLFEGTVGNNLAFGLKVRGIMGRRQRERIYAALGTVGLEGFEKRRARGLSGGEIQRVAIARALALDPRVLLLDEPTSNIDSTHIMRLEQLVPELSRRGVTVVMVTHDQEQPRRMGCSILPIQGGVLQC